MIFSDEFLAVLRQAIGLAAAQEQDGADGPPPTVPQADCFRSSDSI